MTSRRAALALLIAAPLALTACGAARRAAPPAPPRPVTGATPEMNALVSRYAKIHGIPESLLHRVIQRESKYTAGARNGPYYGHCHRRQRPQGSAAARSGHG